MYETFAESCPEMLDKAGKHRSRRIMGVKDRKEFVGYEEVAELPEDKISDRFKLESRISACAFSDGFPYEELRKNSI